MKMLSRSLLLVAVGFVAACGGGGGGGGTPTGAEAVLRLYPPIASVSMPVGAESLTGIEVRGGKGPYAITSSDASVDAGLGSDSRIYLRGAREGESEIAVYDASLPVQIVKFNVTTKAVEITTSVGDAVNLVMGETRTVTLRGGFGPYTVASSDLSIVTASVSGSTLTIAGQAKGGTAKVRVTDARSGVKELSVTVEAVATPALSLTPTGVSGTVGGRNTLVIAGGKAPYTVGSTNTSVATATLSGSTVSVDLVAAGSATVSVTDAAGAVVSATVDVTAAATPPVPVTVAPETQTVLDTNQSAVTYLITGGTAPYSVLLSPADAVVHNASIDNTLTPPQLTMSVKGGQNRCVAADTTISVDVYDAKLAKKTVTLAIKDAAVGCP